ncbi:MAG: site-2 protease family protein [Oscillospiraceae bacterium]|jgi:regulator of sigma E protease|nr:site-2 protease family protein [Oscillospiraceae bacterium]
MSFSAAVSFLTIWRNVWPVLVAILVFIIIIMIHEFGHFLFAKLFGVQVNEFAVGFGPSLLKKKKGETMYSIKAIPFGGYCAMEGEDAQSDNPRAFNRKSVPRKMVIIVGGAAFNLILGFLLVFGVTVSESTYASLTVADYETEIDSPTTNEFLQPGDKILEIGGRKLYTYSEISYMLALTKDGVADMTVLRDGKKAELQNVQFPKAISCENPDCKTESKHYPDEYYRTRIYLTKEQFDDRDILCPVCGTVNKDPQKYTVVDFRVKGFHRTFFNVFTQSFKETVSTARTVWMSLFDMITGKFGLSEVSGPVGVVKIVSQAAAVDVRSLMSIMALITINLGIFNLLPIPALDGGRLIFLIVEGIRRKPVPQKYEGLVHGIGFAALIVFIVLITGKDIIGLFK